MRPFSRPAPADADRWVKLEQTRKAKEAIQDINSAGRHPRSDDFPPAWGESRWADAVAAAQDGLCAWCTGKPVDGGSTGAIDHIRPRASVTRDVGERGSEIGIRGRVEGRPRLPHPPLRPGYWWKAYEPENLVFVCPVCNSSYKHDLWPVHPWRDDSQWRAPQKSVAEKDLVLDPFRPEFDPLAHFRFTRWGEMLPRDGDEGAEATIEVCGLFREVLREARKTLWDGLACDWAAFLRARAAVDGADEARWLALRFGSRCAWSSPHAAFYRVALHVEVTRTQVRWSVLQGYWQAMVPPLDIPEPPADAFIESL